MADTNKLKKEIEIAIKVTGDVGANLKAFSTSFETIARSFDLIQNSLGGMKNIAAEVGSSINAFVSGVGKIELPPKFGEFVGSLSKLNSIKPPNLDKFTTGLSALSTVSVPDSEKMTKIANAIKVFDGITAPSGLADLAKGIKSIHEITKDSDAPITKTAAAITTLTTPLQELGKVKLPNLKNIADGLQGMVGINVGAKSAQFVALEKSLRLLDGIKLPNFKNIIDSIHNMKDLNLTAKSLQFNSLATNLRKLDGIKLPNFKQVVDSVHKLGSTPIDPSFHSKLTQIYYALKSFEDVKSAPSFASLTKSVQALGALRIPADMPKTLNYLAQELKQFAEIKAPPNFNTLLNSIEKANSFKFDPNLAKNLHYLAEELRQFAEIKAPPNLNTLIKSLQAASDFKVPVDLPKRLNYLAQEMKQFAEIKAPPNLNTLIKSIQSFDKLTIPADLHTKLGGLADSFKQFDKVRVPNLNTLVKSIKEMGKLTIPDDLGTKLKDIATAFGVFKGVRIPTLKGLADSLEKFKGVTIDPNLAKTFTELATALGPLQGVKVPALGAMVKGMEGMVKMDLNTFKTRVIEVSAALEKLDKDGRLQSFKGFAEALKIVEAKLGKVSMTARNAHDNISRFGFAAASSTAGLSVFNRNLYGMMRGLSAINQSFTTMTGFTTFFGSLYAIKGVTSYFIEFDDAIRKAGTTSQASSSQVAELARAARLVGEATRYTATDAAVALKELTQAGLSVNEAIGALPGVMQLAASASIDISEAAHISTNVMYGYGMSFEELTFRTKELNDGTKQVAASINDVLTAAFNRSNTDLTQLGVAFKYAGPVAKTAGLAFEETASLLASLAQAGYQGSTAGTTLRRSIANLLSPTKKMQDIMGTYGLEVRKSNGDLRSMIDILDDMRNQGITTGDALEIFGKRAGAGMTALLQASNVELQNMLANMESAAGIARRNAIDMEAGVGGTWRRLVSQWEELKLALGSEISSNIVEFLETLTIALNKNKNTIVDSIGSILDFVTYVVRISASIAVLTAENGKLLVSLTLLVGIIRQAGVIMISHAAAQKALAAAALATATANGTAVAAVSKWATITAMGPRIIAPFVAVLGGLKTAFISLWAVLVPILVNPYVISFGILAAAIAGIVYVAKDAVVTTDDLIERYSELADGAAKSAATYRDEAAALKLLVHDYKAYNQALEKVGRTPGRKLDPDTGAQETGYKSKVPVFEELAFSKALERAASSVEGAIVMYDDLEHAYLRIGEKTYDTVEAIEALIKARHEEASRKDLENITASYEKENALMAKKIELQKELERNEKLGAGKKQTVQIAGDIGGTISSFVSDDYTALIKENQKALSENSLEIQKNQKVIEDAIISYLESGKTFDQFSAAINANTELSAKHKKEILAMGDSYDILNKRIDLANNKITKEYQKQLVEVRTRIQDATTEYDEAIKELKQDLKEGVDAIAAFSGAAEKLVDIELTNIDGKEAVRAAKNVLEAVNRVYVEDTDTRRSLLVKAENNLNNVRVQETIKGLKASYAILESFGAKTKALQIKALDSEFALIEDSKGKSEALQRKSAGIERAIAAEVAAAKVKVTEKAMAAVNAAYDASLKRETELKNKLVALLKSAEDMSNGIEKTMNDSIRSGMSPIQQYYDKIREVDELQVKGKKFFEAGELEKATEFLGKAADLNATLGAEVRENGIELVSNMETQNRMTAKALELGEDLNNVRTKAVDTIGKEISEQEKITNIYAEQSKTLSNALDKLQAIVNEGIKVKIEIDLRTAEEKLKDFVGKEQHIIQFKANLDVANSDMEAIQKKMKDKLQESVVLKLDELTPERRKEYIAKNPVHGRLYEENKISDNGVDTIATVKRKEAVKSLTEELDRYVDVNIRSEKVVNAVKAAEEGRTAALENIVASLKVDDMYANYSSSLTKSADLMKQLTTTKDEAAKASERETTGLTGLVAALGGATLDAVSSSQNLGPVLDSLSSQLQQMGTSGLDAFIKTAQGADIAKQSVEVMEAAYKKAEGEVKKYSAEVQAENERFAKVPQNAATSLEEGREGASKLFKGTITNKVSDTHNKERELNEKLLNDISQLNEQYRRDEKQRAEDLADKKEEIEVKLADDIKKINRDLTDDLDKLNRERAKDQKKVVTDIADLHEATADKIRAIEDRNASDATKNSHAKEDADRKAYEGRKLIEEGLAKADAAQIERGKKLLDQSSDLYAGLKSQQQAKEGVLAVEKEQAKAIDYAEQVAFIEKKVEAEKAAAIKIREAKIASGEAVVAAEKQNAQEIDKAGTKKDNTEIDLIQKAEEARKKLWRLTADEINKYNTEVYLVELQRLETLYQTQITQAQNLHNLKMANLDAALSKEARSYMENNAYAPVPGTEAGIRQQMDKKYNVQTPIAPQVQTPVLAKIPSQDAQIVEKDGKMILTNMVKDGAEAVAAVVNNATEGTRNYAQAVGTGMQALASSTAGVVKDAKDKLAAGINSIGTSAPNFQIPVVVTGTKEATKEIAAIAPTTPISVPIKITDSSTDPVVPSTYDKIKSVSDTVSGISSVGSTKRGLRIIEPEQQAEIDALVEKTRNVFAVMGQKEGAQGLQDMVTALNGVAQNAQISKKEVADMSKEMQTKLAGTGLALVEDIRYGISQYHLVLEGTDKAIQGVSKSMSSTPFAGYSEKFHESIASSLPYIQDIEEGYDDASDKATELAKSVKRIELDDTTKESKKLEQTLGKTFVKGEKDAEDLGATLQDIPVKDTTDNFDELRKSAGDAFSDPVEQAKDLVEAVEDIDGTAADASLSMEEVENSMSDVQSSLAKPAELDIEGLTEAEKDIADLAAASVDMPDVDMTASINTEGEEDVAAARKDVDSLKSKEITVTVNYVTKGKPPAEVENNTEVIPSANKEGGFIERVQKFAAGGYTRGFRKLPSPYISQGSGGKEDDVPALLQKGEFVQKRSAVQKYGVAFMQAINAGRIDKHTLPQFNVGGVVGRVDSLIQKFASGGVVLSSSINKMKRKLEEELLGHSSAATSGMNIHLNNTVVNASSNMQTATGLAGLTSMQTAFASAISRFATGGPVSGSASVAGLRAELNKKYQKDIAKAKSYGDDKLAAILLKEQDDLNEVANQLANDLNTLEQEYNEFKKTTTDEHLARVKEITDTYNETEDKKYGEDTDTTYAKELQELKDSYAQEVLDITESDTADKASYDEAMAQYAKDKADLIKEFEDEKLTVQLEQDAAAIEANRIGLNIAKSLQVIADANPKPVPQPSLRNRVNTTQQIQKHPLLKTFTWDKLIADKFQVALTGYAAMYKPKDKEKPDFKTIANMIEQVKAGDFFKDLKSYTDAGLTVESLRKDYTDKDVSLIQKAHDEELAELEKEKTAETTDYKKSVEESKKGRQETDTEFSTSEQELTTDYTRTKEEAKNEYDTSLAEENTSFDKSMADALEQYEANVQSAKDSAGSEFASIKDSAASEYESEKTRIAEEAAKIKEDITKGSVSKELGATVGEAVSNAIVNSSIGLSFEDFIRKLKRLPTSTSPKLPNDFWKKIDGRLPKFNTGGQVPFSGGLPGVDSVLAALTPGEFVMNAPAVQMFGADFFKALNSFRLPKFNTGGIVDKLPQTSFTASSVSTVRHALDLTVNGNNIGEMYGSPATIESFINALSIDKMRS